jgi:hypothetical protein
VDRNMTFQTSGYTWDCDRRTKAHRCRGSASERASKGKEGSVYGLTVGAGRRLVSRVLALERSGARRCVLAGLAAIREVSRHLPPAPRLYFLSFSLSRSAPSAPVANSRRRHTKVDGSLLLRRRAKSPVDVGPERVTPTHAIQNNFF